jgi:hypothetical protein
MNIQFQLENSRYAQIKKDVQRKCTPGFGIEAKIIEGVSKSLDEQILKAKEFNCKRKVKM